MKSIYDVIHNDNFISSLYGHFQFVEKGKVRSLTIYENTKGIKYIIYKGKRYSV